MKYILVREDQNSWPGLFCAGWSLPLQTNHMGRFSNPPD